MLLRNLPFKIVCSVLMSVVMTFACTKDKKTTSEPKDKKADSAEAPKPIEVYTQKIEKSEIFDPVFFGGIVQATHSSPIFSAVSGIVQKIYQQPGAELQKGQAILAVRPQEAIDADFLPHVISAPISGKLARLDAQVGELVRNDRHLGDVAKMDSYETVIQATYQDLFQFKKGMPVDVLVAVETPLETLIPGKIEYISEQPEPDTGTYAVKVSLKCHAEKEQCRTLLRLGSFVKVVLRQNVRDGFKVSKRSVHEDFRKILLMTKLGKAKWVDIKVGNILGEDVEVASGLEEAATDGSVLVVSFGKYPKEGDSLVAGSKEDSMRTFETKPVSADAKQPKKPAKKG